MNTKLILQRLFQVSQFGGFSFEDLVFNGENIGVKVKLIRKDWDIPFELTVYLRDFPELEKTQRKSIALKKIALIQAISIVFLDEITLPTQTAVNNER